MYATHVAPTVRPQASGVSRRTLLAGMAGGLLTALALGSDPTAAKNKAKKSKSKNGKPQNLGSVPTTTTVSETVTENVTKTETRTFTKATPIAIDSLVSAVPFPAPIRVAGFTGATITDVDLALIGFSHTAPYDVDMMLVAPDGRNAYVMSDVGGYYPVSGLHVRLDDEAATRLPDSQLTSGAFQPTNTDDARGLDGFNSPAPMPSGVTALSVFDGMDPNGEWQLFIRDDHKIKSGSIAQGWELRITATAPGTVTRTTTRTIPGAAATDKTKSKKKKKR